MSFSADPSGWSGHNSTNDRMSFSADPSGWSGHNSTNDRMSFSANPSGWGGHNSTNDRMSFIAGPTNGPIASAGDGFPRSVAGALNVVLTPKDIVPPGVSSLDVSKPNSASTAGATMTPSGHTAGSVPLAFSNNTPNVALQKS
jgi:hypothetical protein